MSRLVSSTRARVLTVAVSSAAVAAGQTVSGIDAELVTKHSAKIASG